MTTSVRTRLGVLAVLVGVLLFAVPAAAARTSFVTPSGGQTVGPMEPGDTAVMTYEVRNSYTLPGQLKLTAQAVVDEEHGCLEPETNEGRDSTCDARSGELGDWLTISIRDSSNASIWTGRLTDLVSGVILDRTMPPSSHWRLDFVSHLPVEAPNTVMTDAVRYDLAWEITAGRPTTVVPSTPSPTVTPTEGPTHQPTDLPTATPTDEPTVAPTEATAGPTDEPADEPDRDEVAGAEAERPSSGRGSAVLGGLLPATGAPISPLVLALSTALVMLGAVMVLAGRRRVEE